MMRQPSNCETLIMQPGMCKQHPIVFFEQAKLGKRERLNEPIRMEMVLPIELKPVYRAIGGYDT